MSTNEPADDGSATAMYRCHGVTNSVANLLLVDPVNNDRLSEVLG